MQTTKTTPRIGYRGQEDSKSSIKNIHTIIKDVPKESYFLINGYDYSYEEMILYAECLMNLHHNYKGQHLPSQLEFFHPDMSIAYVVHHLEQSLSEYRVPRIEMDLEEKECTFYEDCELFTGYVFNYDLSFVYSESIDENMKIGLAHSIVKGLSLSEYHSDFGNINFWDLSFKNLYEGELEYFFEDEFSSDPKGCDRAIKTIKKDLKKSHSLLIKYLKKTFDRKKSYKTKEEREIVKSIKTCLDFDMSLTNQLDYMSNAGDDGIPYEMLHIPIYTKGVSDYTKNFFMCSNEMLDENVGAVGFSYTQIPLKIKQKGKGKLIIDGMKEMMEFDRALVHITKYIYEK